MIFVLAGVNGAGKSSIGGSNLRAQGGDWYNPDEFAKEMHEAFPERPLNEVNAEVWREGVARLKQAIIHDEDFAFETTLGGNSITHTLQDAIASGVDVSVWYCGLGSVELHIKRVAERVARGGHDIPEPMIRKRYESSIVNLCRLAPGLKELAIYDNSKELDENGHPGIKKLLHVNGGRILHLDQDMPDWAKPVAAVCC